MTRLPGDRPTALPQPGFSALTPREREVVTLLAMRFSTAQMATQMALTSNTVRTRVRRALWKLGAADRAAAVEAAHDRGLV